MKNLRESILDDDEDILDNSDIDSVIKNFPPASKITNSGKMWELEWKSPLFATLFHNPEVSRIVITAKRPRKYTKDWVPNQMIGFENIYIEFHRQDRYYLPIIVWRIPTPAMMELKDCKKIFYQTAKMLTDINKLIQLYQDAEKPVNGARMAMTSNFKSYGEFRKYMEK